MKPTEINIEKFSGVNNIKKPEQIGNSELTEAYNVYVTNAGSLKRRDGLRPIQSGLTNSIHSLFTDGTFLYYRQGTNLVRYDTEAATATTLKSDFSESRKLASVTIGEATYLSDGIERLRIVNGQCKEWGVDAPATPTVTNSYGDLRAGQYLVAITFVRDDGQESGASVVSSVNVANGGIAITNIPTSTQSDVDYVAIYASPVNSKTLYRIGVVANGTSAATILHPFTTNDIELQTESLARIPASTFLDYSYGRVVGAIGNLVWYGPAYQPELHDPRFGYIAFDSPVTMLVGVENGQWIGTATDAYFYAGTDPSSQEAPMTVRNRYRFGAISGTGVKSDATIIGDGTGQGSVAIWTSTQGVCVGDNNGALRNVTSNRFAPPFNDRGSAVVLSASDANLYIFSLDAESSANVIMPMLRSNN